MITQCMATTHRKWCTRCQVYAIFEHHVWPSAILHLPLSMALQGGAGLSSVPDVVDWKASSVSKEEETQMTAAVRKNSQPFDFTDHL